MFDEKFSEKSIFSYRNSINYCFAMRNFLRIHVKPHVLQ